MVEQLVNRLQKTRATKKANCMRNLELFLEAGKRVHVEQTGFYLSGDVESTSCFCDTF